MFMRGSGGCEDLTLITGLIRNFNEKKDAEK